MVHGHASHVRPIEADDWYAASGLLAAAPASLCIVVEHVGDMSRLDSSIFKPEAMIDRCTEVEMQLRIDEQASLQSECRQLVQLGDLFQLGSLALVSSGRLVYIRCGDASEAGSGEAKDASRAVQVEILRSHLLESFSNSSKASPIDLFSNRIILTNFQTLNHQLENLTVRAREELINPPSAGERGLITELLETREWLRRSIVIATAIDDAELVGRIESAIRDLDALGALVNSSLLVTILGVSAKTSIETTARNQASEERSAEASRESRRREQRLARYVAALALPALWLEYWSSKPVPDWHGTTGKMLLLLGAIVLAPAGYGLASLVYRGLRARLELGSND